MRSWWRSLKRPAERNYRSTVRYTSRAMPGVRFRIRRISLGRRIALAEAIRELAAELEFQRAGSSAEDQVKAASLAARIDRVYLDWGVTAITGLRIDGHPATPERLFSDGPEALTREIVDRIKSECGLNEQERKN